jgi:hypothetical protein
MNDREREPWTEDDPPPSEEEEQQARRLGAHVDGLLAGERRAAGDELVAAAAMVHAASHAAPLGSAARDRLVDQALADTGAARQGRGRLRRIAPALALAASLLLLISALLTVLAAPDTEQRGGRPRASARLLSRPSDDLMGRPFEDRAGAARRLDLVFADRLSGYRMMTLRAGEGAP